MKRILITFVVTLIVTALGISKTYALGEASLSIGFAPTAIYLDMTPGKLYKGEITFWNLAPSTLTYNVRVRGFKQIEEIPGTSRVLTDFEETKDPYSASKWITVEQESVKLRPNEYFTLPYSIKIPEDIAVGEFHATIFLQSADSDSSSLRDSLALANLGSGPAILINTGDNLDENAIIEYFRTEKSFYEYPPVLFETMYLNKGNTHITPVGDIILENFLGQEIERFPFNENRQSLLRANSAVYKSRWENETLFFKNGKIAIGPIKAKLITTYKAKFPGFSPLSATTSFWVLPWKIILAVIISITAIIYFLREKFRKVSKKPFITYTNEQA